MTSASPPERPARRRRSDGERSRSAILREAARLATVEGVDGLSLSRLADAVGMSKSGLFAHFGSKEELQLATVEAANEIFEREVIAPAQDAPPGAARLRAYADRFLAHLEAGVFPGGCFFASAISELDTRPGPVRDRTAQTVAAWLGLLAAEVSAAVEAGEFPPGTDPEQLAFELNAFMNLGNLQYVLSGDRAKLDRARVAIETRLRALES